MADGSVIIDTILKTDGLNKGIGDLEGKLGKIGSKMTSIGAKMTIGLTAPLVGVGAAALSTFATFEKQMNRVSAVSGATGKDFEALEKQAMQLGASSVFSATQVAEGQEMMASAGFNAKQILGAMPGVMDLAAVSGGNMALASEAVATAMNQFGIEAGNAGHVADVFARAAADTNAETTDMAEALKYAGPVTSAFGMSLEETAAAIGIMSNAGIKGSQAGTTLRTSLLRLADPTDEAANLMKELGLNFFDSQGKMLPLSGIVDQLKDRLGGLSDQQKQAALSTIFGKESISGMLALMNSAPGEVQKLTDSFIHSDGAAKNMADTMNGGLAGSIESLKGSLETAGITIGKILSPAIEKVINWIQNLVDGFNNLDSSVQKIIVGIGVFVAALGPIILIVGTIVGQIAAFSAGVGMVYNAVQGLIAVFTFLASPVGLLVAAIVAVVAVIIYLWNTNESFKQAIINAWNQLVSVVSPLIQALSNVIQTVFGAVMSWWKNNSESILTAVGIAWQSFLILLQGVWNTIVGVVQVAVSVISGVINLFLAVVQGDWSGAWEAIKSIFSGVWQGIQTIFSGFVSIFAGAFGVFLGLMATMWQVGWSVITSVFQTIWNTVVAIASGIWEGLKIAFQAVCDFFGNLWNTVWTGVQSFFSTVWAGIVAIASAIWEGLKSAFQGFSDFITNIWNTTWTGIQNFFSTIVSAIVSFGTSTFNGFQSTLSGIWDGIKSTASSAWENLKSAVLNIIGGLVSGAQRAWNNMVSGVQSLISNVTGLFNGLRNINLFGAGQAIINGFLNGLRSAFSAVQSFVGGIASWIREHKGPIEYDRKLLIPAGDAIMSGLDRGLDDGFGDVQRRVGSMASSISDKFNKNISVFSADSLTAGMSEKIAAMRRFADSQMSGMNFAPRVAVQPAVVVNISNEADSDIIRQRVNAKNAQQAIINELFRKD